MSLRQTADGIRHAICPLGGAEHTLCGIAYDVASVENEPQWEVVPLTGCDVTCINCAAVILACRGLKISSRLA